LGTVAEGGTTLPRCISCGVELHPERAEKYEYCTKPECREKNAAGLTIVSVGVNKSADQFQILDQRTKDDLAAGKHHDPRRGSYGSRPTQSAPNPAAGKEKPKPGKGAPPRGEPRRGAWTPSQERLALLYNERGLRPEEIAEKLGISRYAATQAILAARKGSKRS
jgi:DNA-directed RNA polymerase subunit N (RpoN/RPB10)